MCLRTVPYGYTVERGQKVIVADEAVTVENVFERYCAGDTFKQIADSLTECTVAYSDNDFTWNKNNIARMIDDARYLGNEEYPRIVSAELFARAKVCREERSAKKAELSPQVKLIKNRLVCGRCGGAFSRKNKWRTREKWMCANGCKCVIYLDDQTIIRGIDRIFAHPSVCAARKHDVDGYIPNSDVTRMTNDINRMLEQRTTEFKTVANTILECASARFECCHIGVNDEMTRIILAMYEKATAEDRLDGDLISGTVDRIIMHEDGKITLRIKSGAEIIGGEPE